VAGTAAARPAVVNAHVIDGRHVAREVRGRNRTEIRARSGNVPVVQRGADGK
jgi:hypothetical protein